MSLLVQDVLVTAVALGALGVLIQRVVGVITPAQKTTGCSHCASCAPSAEQRSNDVQPVTLRRG